MAVVGRELQYLPAIRKRTNQRRNRLGAVGSLTMLGLALWVAYAASSAALAWAQIKVDDIRYGYPRSYQTDGFIGYREESGIPTHFTVLNAHRQVLIIIVPGGEPSQVTVIKGPYLFGPGQEFSPATLDVVDVNRDGYADLRLRVAGQTLVYMNDHRRRTFIVSRTQGGSTR